MSKDSRAPRGTNTITKAVMEALGNLRPGDQLAAAKAAPAAIREALASWKAKQKAAAKVGTAKTIKGTKQAAPARRGRPPKAASAPKAKVTRKVGTRVTATRGRRKANLALVADAAPNGALPN